MTPWEWHAEIFEAARHEGLHFLSTPFDASAVEFLDGLGVPVYKVASFELVDIGLLRAVGATGKPVIMSTGMATAEEIEEAVDTVVGAGASGVALLRCNSTYPASPDEIDLLTIPHMAERFKWPIGLSDHTLTNATTIAAVALGACIVEKHLTLDRGDGGPDAGFSLEPAEFAGLVGSIREAEQVLGGVRYGPTAGELPSHAAPILGVAHNLRAGQVVSPDDVRSVRPGGGMHRVIFPTSSGAAPESTWNAAPPLTLICSSDAWRLINTLRDPTAFNARRVPRRHAGDVLHLVVGQGRVHRQRDQSFVHVLADWEVNGALPRCQR